MRRPGAHAPRKSTSQEHRRKHDLACRPVAAGSLFASALAVLSIAAPGAAQAQISRGFIGPHEYSLPVEFKPFNIFVEYVTLQKTERAWDGDGDRTDAGNTETLVALSKYVRLWTPESNPKLGIAWEVIVPKVGVRNKEAGDSTGGIGDPITGFALWTKPVPEWTLGGDFFVQVPVGDKDVGGGDRWNLIGSLFWDGQYGKFNYTGNLGFNFPGSPTSGPRPGRLWHLNNRFGWRVNDLLEPYVGLDYERQQSSDANPSNHEFGGALGLMFHVYPNAHISVHYQKGFRGESRPLSNNLNLRVAYVF